MSLIKSWVTSANTSSTDFPLNNLPYGVFSVDGVERRCGVAIGELILDVTGAEQAGLLNSDAVPVFGVGFWNDFMALGPDHWSRFRAELTRGLAAGSPQQGALRAASAGPRGGEHPCRTPPPKTPAHCSRSAYAASSAARRCQNR